MSSQTYDPAANIRIRSEVAALSRLAPTSEGIAGFGMTQAVSDAIRGGALGDALHATLDEADGGISLLREQLLTTYREIELNSGRSREEVLQLSYFREGFTPEEIESKIRRGADFGLNVAELARDTKLVAEKIDELVEKMPPKLIRERVERVPGFEEYSSVANDKAMRDVFRNIVRSGADDFVLQLIRNDRSSVYPAIVEGVNLPWERLYKAFSQYSVIHGGFIQAEGLFVAPSPDNDTLQVKGHSNAHDTPEAVLSEHARPNTQLRVVSQSVDRERGHSRLHFWGLTFTAQLAPVSSPVVRRLRAYAEVLGL